MATLSSVGTSGLGKGLKPLLITYSPAKRFSALIDMDSPPVSKERQRSSQGWWQIKPQEMGKGFGVRMTSKASRYSPRAIWATKAGTSVFNGQLYLQGVKMIFLQTMAGQRLYLMC